MIRHTLITMLLSLTPFFSISQNDFAFHFFNQFEQDDNILFSPTSILAAFSIAYEGSEGETKKAFQKTFGFSETNDDFILQLNELKKYAEINNAVWIQTGYKILDKYINSVSKKHNAIIGHTDFLNHPDESAKKINNWIKEATNGMISKMVTPADVKAFTLAIVNAIYFKQSWKKPFDKDVTKEEEFTNLDGSTSKTPLMFNRGMYMAYENEREQIIRIPYADGKTSMIIILPSKMKNHKLDKKTYQRLKLNSYNQEVKLHLPRFTFETKTFELKNQLIKLGLGSAFSDRANFGRMRTQKDLKIGTALHKAKIIVNEEGTEAAAATVIGMVRTTSAIHIPNPVMEMRIDKPFYYFIQEDSTETILFMGKMNQLKTMD
ncbi:serpin family protein [Crocinitomix algicola]|uniref:serpin family protein n=1 Tax=Crocinitomix algicola TaxID=1740263 RepID=UPI0009F2131F|nr:serpin family protein [Crocinitomix algicola]